MKMVKMVIINGLIGQFTSGKTYWKAWFARVNLQDGKCKKASVTLCITPANFTGEQWASPVKLSRNKTSSDPLLQRVIVF